MRSSFTRIETAMRALNAMQLALDTTTHNIANANTPGYSRQRVDMSASTPYTLPSMHRNAQPVQIGTGVDIVASGDNSALQHWNTLRAALGKRTDRADAPEKHTA